MESSPARVTVTVVDAMAVVRRGLVDVLRERGFATAPAGGGNITGQALETTDVWVVVLRTETDWKLLMRLSEMPSRHPVVALLADPTPRGYRDAMNIGATCVLACQAAAELLPDAVEAALRRRALLAPEVVQAMLRPIDAEDLSLTELQHVVLTRLAEGDSMRQIAAAAGCSQREAFRILRRIYERLGVQGRSQALVRAARLGLLNDPWVGPAG